MDWLALWLSLRLAFWTTVILVPGAIVIARILAWQRFRGRGLVEALVTLPLVLPPTVLGYYILVALGRASPLGSAWEALTGQTLVFNFTGLLIASIIFNLPFAIQPIQRSLEGISPDIREAAWCSGLSAFETFRRIELPLGWPGILSAIVLTFAHTLGEFGVVLMVGGNIPGETRTVAIAIYDRVQVFDDAAAGTMALTLLIFSFAAIAAGYIASGRIGRRHG
jgi:molybdate transport system permease protein